MILTSLNSAARQSSWRSISTRLASMKQLSKVDPDRCGGTIFRDVLCQVFTRQETPWSVQGLPRKRAVNWCSLHHRSEMSREQHGEICFGKISKAFEKSSLKSSIMRYRGAIV